MLWFGISCYIAVTAVIVDDGYDMLVDICTGAAELLNDTFSFEYLQNKFSDTEVSVSITQICTFCMITTAISTPLI
jgi:hypothetical protein